MVEELPASRREQAKDGRRARIVEAASRLLREVGSEAMSVKAIAQRADVSPATVYNLFGSKSGVLEGVYALGLTQFEQVMGQLGARDALDIIFVSVRLSAAAYRAEPRFHLGLILRGDGGRDRHMALAMHRLRSNYWTTVLEQAVAEGLLEADSDLERIGVLMVQQAAGALTHWAAGLIGIDELEQELTFGLAAVLWPFATSRAQPRLEARMRKAEERRACLANPLLAATAGLRPGAPA